MADYPLLPTPLSVRLNVTGTFDPVAAVPAVINGVGTPQQLLLVSRAGRWNFATGLPDPDLGTDLAAGDLVFYFDGTWRAIRSGQRSGSAQRLFTINDDAVATASFARAAGVAHLLVISDATLPAASIAFDLSRPVARKIYDSGTLFNIATGALAGTTSTDTKINVSAYNGKLYIENRTGAQIKLSMETGVDTSNGGALPRSGALPMDGLLDMAGNAILLRTGSIRGEGDGQRGVAAYLDLSGGTYAARSNLLALRGREVGGSPTPSLLKHELAIDALTEMGNFPTVWVGLDNSGASVAELLGPERQVELRNIAQIVDGLKTFRHLRFGSSGQEMELPTVRGFPGQALVQSGDGTVDWGGIELAANSRIISLAGLDPLLTEFNATARTIGPQDLVFIRHGESTYLWIGGAGTWGGVGNPEAVSGNISAPVFTAGGVPYATVGEVEEGTEEAKAISPAVAAATLMGKSGDDQIVNAIVRFMLATIVDAAGALTVEGPFLATGTAQVTADPRSDEAGANDIVRRGNLDTRLLDYPLATGGKINPTQMTFTRAVDIRSRWNPNDPLGVLPRNVPDGGGLTPIAYTGTTLYVSTTGGWNFTTGAPDGSGTLLYAGNLVIWNEVIDLWQIYDYRVGATSGGGVVGDYLPTSNPSVQGTMSFSTGGKLRGASAANPLLISNAELDAGIY